MKILSPCGNIENFFTALNAGTDAVYLGLKKFSARATAGNFSFEELALVSSLCKIFKVELYVTINIILHNHNLNEICNILKQLESYYLTGIIIQDMAIYEIAKKYFPKFNLIASTQASVINRYGVLFFEELGFYQVVLARELDFEEIKSISQNSKIKLEVFIHGAQCFAYSGQCNFSAMIGGRSANKGSCAQMCRTAFKNNKGEEKYFLSKNDLMVDQKVIDNLAEIQIDTLKIEGRMRSSAYVYSANQYLRSLIEKRESSSLKNSARIAYDRGFFKGHFFGDKNCINHDYSNNRGLFLGISEGYNEQEATIKKESSYLPKKGDGITIYLKKGNSYGFNLNQDASLDKKGNIIISQFPAQFKKNAKIYINSEAVEEKILTKLRIDVIATNKGNKFELKLLPFNKTITLESEESLKDKDNFISLIRKKLNNYQYEFFFINLVRIDIKKSIFLPYKQIREALNSFFANFISKTHLSYKSKEISKTNLNLSINNNITAKKEKKYIVIVYNLKTLELCSKYPIFKIYLNFEFYLKHKDYPFPKDIYILLPAMINEKNADKIYNSLLPLKYNLVCRNAADLNFFKNYQKKIDLFYSFNIANHLALDFYLKFGIDLAMISLEAMVGDFQNNQTSIYAFGYPLIMSSNSFPQKQNCNNKTNYLIDKKDARYNFRIDPFSNYHLFHYKPIFLKNEDIAAIWHKGISNFVLDLNFLDFDSCKNILDYYFKGSNFSKYKPFKGRYGQLN